MISFNGRRLVAATLFGAGFLVLAGPGAAQLKGPSAGPRPVPQPGLPSQPPALALPTTAEEAKARFFQSVVGVQNATGEEAESHRREAQGLEASRKRAVDFVGSCPSPAAQALYDDLGSARSALAGRLPELGRIDDQARDALRACLKAYGESTDVPPRPMAPPTAPTANPAAQVCFTAYQSYRLANLTSAANAALTACDAGRRALAALPCRACLVQGGWVSYPVVQIRGGGGPTSPTAPNNTPLPVPLGPKVQIADGTLKTNVPAPNGTVDACVQWDPGSFWITASARQGELEASQKVKLPHCARTERIGNECEAFDVSATLPKLKELRLVPPDATADLIQINIPRRTVQIPTGLRPVPGCTKDVRICKRATGTMNIDTGDPLSVLQGSGQCVEWTSFALACANPPWGIEAVYTPVTVPDLVNATVTLRRPGAPTVRVDFTRPDLQVSCAKRAPAAPLLTAPEISVSTGSLEVPLMCRRSEERRLVGRP